MNSIDKLIEKFTKFPGIGPKQARRFVYFLITRPDSYIEEFKNELSELKAEVSVCVDCKRYFVKNGGARTQCVICADTTRDATSLMIVARDIDLDNIEKSHTYLGKYFVLGGLVPILDKEPEKRIRLKELLSYASKLADAGLKEIVLGLDANAEAEYTADLLRSSLAALVEKHSIKISELGRGLSTGTELEYSDPETIKNALKNRS